MTRILQFDPTEEGKTRFMILYQGFLGGGNTVREKGMEVVRREARILDQLESISNELPDGMRVLKMDEEKEQVVHLGVPEYDLLKRYVEACPWAPIVSKKVVAVVDWLIDVPKT